MVFWKKLPLWYLLSNMWTQLERFFQNVFANTPEYPTLTQTALSFLLNFARPCRSLSTTHPSFEVTKRANFQPNIILWIRYRGYSGSHWAHRRRPPGSHEIWGPTWPKTKHHLCPRRIRTHTQTLHLTGVTFGTAKGKERIGAGGRCYPALFREALFLDQTRSNPRRHSY